MPDAIVRIIVFIFGSLIGSFLNVCIYRLPRSGKVGKSDFSDIFDTEEALSLFFGKLILSGYIDEEGYVEKKFKKLRKQERESGFILPDNYAKNKGQIFEIIDKSCDLSIASPKRSFCPNCNRQVLWYDNVPMLSYIILLAKCRFCKQKIPFRYFLVELITASLLVVLYNFFGLSAKFFVYGVLSFGLIAATFIDFDFQIIPDEITLGGLVVGIVLSIVFPQLHGTAVRMQAFIASILGMLAGGGSIYLIGRFGEILFKKESMGGGDVKFLAMIGSVLGWQFTLLIFFLAPFFGAAVGIIARISKGDEVIPYGPYLSLATFLVILWGQDILQYLFYV